MTRGCKATFKPDVDFVVLRRVGRSFDAIVKLRERV